MKKNQIAAVLFSLTMLAGAGCSAKINTSENSSVISEETQNESTGSWVWNQSDVSLDANKDVKEAFEKAMQELTGVHYEPIAYLAYQVVSGNNYCILCRSTVIYPDAEATYSLVTIYEDLEGNAEMIDAKDIVSDEWDINEEDISIEKHQDVQKLFEDALKDMIGAEYEAIAYLGKKADDYLLLCRVTPVSLNASVSYVLVTVNEEGIADTEDIDIGASSASQLADPYMEVESLEEAAELTGFEISVPEAEEDHPDMIIRVLDDDMIEVIYVNDENETEDGLDEAYRIRKAEGDDDISGDYNEYGFSKMIETENGSINIKGNGNACCVAVWQKDGYTYALDVDENYQMGESDMLSIIEAVK